MRNASFTIMILLSIVVLISACGPSQAELDTTATQMTANNFASQTAQAPTVTSTPPPSLTPTTTPTIAPTPTNTPTIMPTPTPRLMATALTLDDLPAGFQVMSIRELSDLKKNLPASAIAFGFNDDESSHIIIGYLIPFNTRVEQVALDRMLPELIDSYVVILGADTNPENLTGLDDIGESHASSTFVSEINGTSIRWDIVTFRRGEILVILFDAYPDGGEPAVPVGDLAHIQDERLAKSLGIVP